MSQNSTAVLRLDGLMIFTPAERNRFLEAGILSADKQHLLEIKVEKRSLSGGKAELVQSTKFGREYLRQFEEAWVYPDSGSGVVLKDNAMSLADEPLTVGNEKWKRFVILPDLEGVDFCGGKVDLNPDAVRPALRITTGKFFAFSPFTTLDAHTYLAEAAALRTLKEDPEIIAHKLPAPGLTTQQLHDFLLAKLGNACKELDDLATVVVTRLELEQGRDLVICLGKGHKEIIRLKHQPDTEFTITVRNFPEETPSASNHNHGHHDDHHEHSEDRHFFHTLLFDDAVVNDGGIGEKKRVFVNTTMLFTYFSIKNLDQTGAGNPICPLMRRSISAAEA